jgi:hypothetical protein
VSQSAPAVAAADHSGTQLPATEMKRPESTDFEVKVFDAGADVIFKPSSYYWFSRFADFADILRYGHLSQSANVRHAGRTGDTDGFDPSEVLAEARRVALRAAMDAYEKNECCPKRLPLASDSPDADGRNYVQDFD